ncbi:hypothetical protein DNTS_011124, partial [Danionella cerebrum]
PSLVGVVRKDWASEASIALSWQETDQPHDAILDYEIKYYEKEQEQLSYSSTRTKSPSVIVSGLKPSTIYAFHVRARTLAGYTSYGPRFEFATGDQNSEEAADQGQVLVIVTATVGGFSLLVILTLFLLITGSREKSSCETDIEPKPATHSCDSQDQRVSKHRHTAVGPHGPSFSCLRKCQWYIKSKIKTEDKKRTQYQNGLGPFPGLKTYIDPDTYEDPSQAVHEFAKEIDPSGIRIERVIGAGRPVMIVVEYMENGSLDSFLRVILSIEEGYRLPAPMGCPVALHQLMLLCWQKDRSHRPCFSDIVSFLDKLIRNPSSLLTLVEDVPSFPESPEDMPAYPLFISIGDWLDSIKMSQYKNNFIAAGYTTLDSISTMNIDDVRRIGVSLIGHQRRIVSSIQALRLQFLHMQQTDFHENWTLYPEEPQ